MPHAPGPDSRHQLAVPLVAVDDLRVSAVGSGGPVPILHGVSLALHAGETLALVGESGCGKSVTARSIVRLLPPGLSVTGGSIVVDGVDVGRATEEDMRRLRGGRVGFVFQEPSAALSPVYTIGAQVAEAVLAHERGPGAGAASARAIELLGAVGMPDPAQQANAYPHQLSGGLRQRAMIAIALACRPALLIADEPTTALDATLQADILALLRDLRARFGLALLLITHDLGVVASLPGRVAVMYAGRIVEEGPVSEVLASPAHPYTRGLIASIPSGRGGTPLKAMAGGPPRPGKVPPGCAFAPRCPLRFDACDSLPQMRDVSGLHHVSCHAIPQHAGSPLVGEPTRDATGQS